MGLAISIISILFFIFAIALSKGKGASILTGYNSMSASDKVQYDEVALCKFMAKIMYGVSFSILMMALGEFLENQALLIIGIVLLVIFIIFSLVYSNTKDRFIRKELNDNH